MTFSQLEALLIENAIADYRYRINELPSDNTFCIQYDGERTVVFYFERGIHFDEKSFTDKDKAIEYFLKLLNK